MKCVFPVLWIVQPSSLTNWHVWTRVAGTKLTLVLAEMWDNPHSCRYPTPSFSSLMQRGRGESSSLILLILLHGHCVPFSHWTEKERGFSSGLFLRVGWDGGQCVCVGEGGFRWCSAILFFFFFYNIIMCATVQKREATDMCFHVLTTHWVFSLAALLLWSLNLWGLLQRGSRNQSAVVFMTFNYVCSSSTNHVSMGNFYFVAFWSLFHFSPFFFFCKHTEVRLCVLWNNAIYSGAVTWQLLYYSFPFCHIKKLNPYAWRDRKRFSNKRQLPLNKGKLFYQHQMKGTCSNTTDTLYHGFNYC